MAFCNIYIPVLDSTPREVMEQVVKPTEDYLRTVPDVKRITSSSSARRARILLEFSSEANASAILVEIRDRLERAKSEWPEGVDRYYLWRLHSNDIPVYMSAVSMDVDESKVDVDANQQITAKHGIQSIPTLMVFKG